MNLFSQRRAAGLTAVAFVLATIAIPALHLAFHDLPHEHAGAQTHYHLTPAGDDHAHEHAAGLEEHHATDHHHDSGHDRGAEGAGHRHDGDAGADAEDDRPFDPRHGAGSAAHFSVALSDAAATAFVLPLHRLAPQSGVSSPAAPFLATAHVSVQRFRGPPAVEIRSTRTQ